VISRPLFARNVFNEDTFTKTGMNVIKDTRSLQTIVARNSRPLDSVYVRLGCDPSTSNRST
jgi:prostaglandin-endoperoxide synthase 2